MIRRPPRSTRTDTLFPYTTLFRSLGATLRIESNSLDQLVIRRTGVESEPESFDVTSRLFLRSGDGFFATQLQVGVVPRDGQDRDVAEIAICVTTRWRSEERRVGKVCVSKCRYQCAPYH